MTYTGSGNSLTYASDGNQVAPAHRPPASFFQHQVHNAGGGGFARPGDGPIGHRLGPGVGHADGQVIASKHQVANPQVQVGRAAAELPGPQGPRDARLDERLEQLAQLQASYFFGQNSPFNSADTGSSTTNNNYYYLYPYLPFFGYGFGSGYGLGFGGVGGGGNYVASSYRSPVIFRYWPNSAPAIRGNARVLPVAAAVAAQVDGGNGEDDELDNSLDFSGQGEADFRQGKYRAAVHSWRHALVDDPKNGAIILLLSQALFATGQYDEAAGATQAALSFLPEDKWGTVVTHYKELYTNIGDYTTQLRALEKARDAKPRAPALHFLLGYHFGYLNFPKQAVRELDKVLAVAPEDKIAKKLRDEFFAKLTDEEKAAADKQARAEKEKAAKEKKDAPDKPGPEPEKSSGGADDGAKGEQPDAAKPDGKDKKDAEAPGTDA